MSNKNYQKNLGVTLMEVLLVLVIAGSLLVFMMRYMQQRADELRRTHVTLQIQQILNAGLTFYVANNRWPANIAELQDQSYLPNRLVALVNPWANGFEVTSGPSSGMLYVYTNVNSSLNASAVAGRLPIAYLSDSKSIDYRSCIVKPLPAKCTFVVASVNLPPQNLNNAPAVTFANIYHNGACVPVPDCPVDSKGNTMVPQIIVAPVSVNGVNEHPARQAGGGAKCIVDANGHNVCDNLNAYPIYSYTAFAKGPALLNTSFQTMIGCDGSQHACDTDYKDGTPILAITPGKQYWRVCLFISTEKGRVDPVYGSMPYGNGWGLASGSVVALTRCQPKNEDSGSGFYVWSP